jgi:DNA-binding LacI/PurR family transcriptional regulator
MLPLRNSRPLPFSINRSIAVSLSDQVADGLRRAIVSGYYQRGDVLPTLEELAKELGTSLRVPRDAVARLAAENLVSPRPRVGSVILASGETHWSGQVMAVVPMDHEGTFHSAVFLGEMRRQLAAAGYLFATVTLDRKKGGGWDFAYLDLMLRQKQDMVFALYCPPQVIHRIERAGVPIAANKGDMANGPGQASLGELVHFIDHCASMGVRRVLAVGFDRDTAFDGEISRLREAGLEVEPCLARVRTGFGFLEHLQQAGLELMLRRFQRPRETWPDLVFWTDDYLAVGGLSALQGLGVRIPGDVFAVTLANKGFLPAFPRTLTRLEFDPVATGRAAAANIVDRLAGRAPAPILDVVAYVVGETFPAPRRKGQSPTAPLPL